MPSVLSDPVKLPCGVVLPNRLSKVSTYLGITYMLRNDALVFTNGRRSNPVTQAAMAEQMAKSSDHTPDDSFVQAYSRWAEGGWGSILTGSQYAFYPLEDGTRKPTYRRKRPSRRKLPGWSERPGTPSGL